MTRNKPLHFFCNALLVVVFLAVAATGRTQTLAQQDGLVAYSAVVEVPGVSKAELMERAKNWLSGTRHSVSFVSEEMGMVSAGSELPFRSAFESTHTLNGRIVYVATLIIQDGYFMYEFNNFFHEGDPAQPHAADLGFVTLPGTRNKDLNKPWKTTAMEEVRVQIAASIEKSTDLLKKALFNESPSFSLNGN